MIVIAKFVFAALFLTACSFPVRRFRCCSTSRWALSKPSTTDISHVKQNENVLPVYFSKLSPKRSHTIMRESLKPLLELVAAAVHARDGAALLKVLRKAAMDLLIANDDFNYLCTKSINSLGAAQGMSLYSRDIIDIAETSSRSPDIILYTAAMSVLIRFCFTCNIFSCYYYYFLILS